MRDTIRGIVGKLRKGVSGYILVAVDSRDYSIHSWDAEYVGELPYLWSIPSFYIVIGWYKDPIKMTALRAEIERKIGGISL